MRSFTFFLSIVASVTLLVVVTTFHFVSTGRAEDGGQTPSGLSVYVPFTLRDPSPVSATPPAYPAPPDPTPTTGPGTGRKPEERTIISRINQEREEHGLHRLEIVAELTESARRHCRDMAENHFTGHTGSDGSTAGERMRDAGYDWSRRAELIGWGFSTPEKMMHWWLNSDQHRRAILSPHYEDMGVCYLYDAESDWDHYWTVNLGVRATESMQAHGEQYRCQERTEGRSGGGSLSLTRNTPCR